MFALNQLKNSSRRIGLGVAVAALALTSFASPINVFAAQGGPIDTPPPTHTPHKIPSDLQVIGLGKTYSHLNGNTYYQFKIRNNGPAPVMNGTAYKEAQTSGFQLQNNGYFNISLASGAEQTVTVTCSPPFGQTCKQATVLVLNPGNDSNLSNNIVTQY